MSAEDVRSYLDRAFIADKLFPVVDVSAKRIEYPRGNWGERPAPLTRWQRVARQLRRHARSGRYHVARWIAGDQWPSDEERNR